MTRSKLHVRALWVAASLAVALAGLAIAGCEDWFTPTAPPPVQECVGYVPQEDSPYVLPYPVGESYFVLQGNCTGLSHFGRDKYSYDISMPIGTTVTAIQGGVVIRLNESFADGDRSTIAGNGVTIDHGDGTYGGYVHLMHQGVLVEVGDLVSAGQPIALSGDSGSTTGQPHLHLETLVCNFDFTRCETVPMTFRNASPEANGGLQAGVTYTATGF